MHSSSKEPNEIVTLKVDQPQWQAAQQSKMLAGRRAAYETRTTLSRMPTAVLGTARSSWLDLLDSSWPIGDKW